MKASSIPITNAKKRYREEKLDKRSVTFRDPMQALNRCVGKREHSGGMQI